MHRGCFVWTPTPPLAGRRTPRPGPVRVCVCLLFLAGSGGPASRARSGAPHLFLWPLCLSAFLGPLRAGVAPLSFAAVAVPRWLFFSDSCCLARASFVSSAWPLAALWWLFPRPPPLCVSGFCRSCLWPWCFFFFFFFFLRAPPLSPAPSGFRRRVPWASALALFVLLAFRFSALRALFPLSCHPWLLAAPAWLLPPPPPFVSRGFRSCRSALCAVSCCASPGAVLRRAAARCVARCCAVVCCVALVWCRCLLRRALWRCPSLWGPVLCGAVFCGVPPALCVLCCVCFAVARWCVLLFAALPCAVCVSGCCAVRSLCSPFCAVLCFAVLVRSRCAVRVVRAAAGAWCCGALLCVVLFPVVCRGAVLSLVARGCLLVACFGVGVSVWPRGLLPCGWCGLLWCPAFLCRVLWCCAVAWCCAVVLCCRVAVLSGLALPSCGLWAVLCCAVGWLCCFWPGGGVCVLWCSFPRAVCSLSSPLCALRCLVVLAVVPCFPVSCAVALCCRVVLCCRALLSFCGAVCVCFALLRPVVRRLCRLRCRWCLVLWRVPVRCGVSLGVLRCGGAALVCRGVLLCCALSCGVLRSVPCPAVPCCPAVLCWLAVLCGCLRCWCLFCPLFFC